MTGVILVPPAMSIECFTQYINVRYVVSQNPKENIFFLRKDYLATHFCKMQTKICMGIFHHTYVYMLDKIHHVFNRYPQMAFTQILRTQRCPLLTGHC